MKNSLVLFLVALVGPAFASDRESTLRALMDAQGLEATYGQMIQSTKELTRHQADQILTQALSGFTLPEDFRQRVRAAADRYVEAMESKRTAKDIVAMWSDVYGSHFTTEELEQLLAFYSSPLAQRETVVGREAMQQLMVKLQEENRPQREAATKAYVSGLQAIIRDCKCKK
jgi:hypothetical protein